MKSRFESPTPLSDILSKLLKRKGIEKRINQHEIFVRWVEIAGDSVAKRAVPRQFKGDILFVAVKNHSWMNELQFLKPNLMAKINSTLPSVKIKDIRFCLAHQDELD